MNLKKAFLALLFSAVSHLQTNVLEANVRASSAPYISGDSFREYCDFLYDETSKNLVPELVTEGAAVFVKTDLLNEFFSNVHPKILNKYILITHNSADEIPGRYSTYLEDPKLIVWFGQNVSGCSHRKLIPIPIGIANRRWPSGNLDTFSKMKNLCKHVKKDTWLYMNFSINTFPLERSNVYQIFSQTSYCKNEKAKGLEPYLQDLAKSYFVLSPRGFGLDCHRTWETLYLGSIPIVFSSTLNPLYEDLPVLVIDDWEKISLEFLQEKYSEMESKKYNYKKLDFRYWEDLIESYKTK